MSRGLFHERGLEASHKDEKIHRTDSSGKLPKVLVRSHVPSAPIICMLQRWPPCYVITPAPSSAVERCKLVWIRADYLRSTESYICLHAEAHPV